MPEEEIEHEKFRFGDERLIGFMKLVEIGVAGKGLGMDNGKFKKRLPGAILAI
jgi:hypothetical protein